MSKLRNVDRLVPKLSSKLMPFGNNLLKFLPCYLSIHLIQSTIIKGSLKNVDTDLSMGINYRKLGRVQDTYKFVCYDDKVNIC